jgi:hypothetical protein
MIWHITDDDEGIDEADLRVALNRIQLEHIDLHWDTKLYDTLHTEIYKVTGGPMQLVNGPTLLSVLKRLGVR